MTNDFDLNLTPAEHDFVCQQGETWIRAIPYYDTDGVLVDLTGYTAAMSVKRRGTGSALLELTTANSRINLNTDADGEEAEGYIQLKVADSDTEALTPSTRGRYDLQLIDANGETTVIQRGRFLVIAGVT